MSQTRHNFIVRDEGFLCKQCGASVEPLGRGCRNHCNHCLYSCHVDDQVPGDRASDCGGLMKPTQLESGSRKGYLGFDVVHECMNCGKIIRNLLAEDDAWEHVKLNSPNASDGLK